MLAEGLEKTLVETGSHDNVVVIRKGSSAEVQSGIEREKASTVETEPEIAIGMDGRKLLAKEIVVLIDINLFSFTLRVDVSLSSVMHAME